MKKITLTLAAAGLCAATYAQEDPSIGLHYPTKKGTILLGGDLGLTNFAIGSSGKATQAFYNVGVSPRIGYFIADNVVLGLSLNGNTSVEANFHSTFVGASVFGRYYFGSAIDQNKVIKKLRFFAEAGVGINRGRTNWGDVSDNTYGSYFYTTVTAHALGGVNYMLSRNVALEGGMYYSRSSYISRDAKVLPNQNAVGARIGIQIFLKGKR